MTNLKLRHYYFYNKEQQCEPDTSSHTNIINEGEYKAIVTRNRAFDCFGWEHWKQSTGSSLVTFYKNDIEIFKHYSQCGVVILHTLNNITRFLIISNGKIQVYDMNNNNIYSDISVGTDQFVDFARVSDKYAIGLTEELCTFDPYGSIWDLDGLMFGGKSAECRFYSDHRTPIPLCGKCVCKDIWYNKNRVNINHTHARFIPFMTTEEGFTVWDTYENKLLDKIVSYEEAYNGDFEFDPQYIDPLESISKMCGRSVEELEDEMLKNDGKLSFNFNTYEGPN